MSEKTRSSIEDRLVNVGIEAVWAQWSVLGAGTLRDNTPPSSIIDPEALLLLSLYFLPAERRLRDLVRWWAEVGSELLSVQRTRTLLEDFPSDVSGPLSTYGHWAMQAGDKRWERYAQKGETDNLDRARKGPARPDLGSHSSLLLRLRAGFGVSAKADVLAFLLGIGERWATTKNAREATGYSRATVRGALEDLSRAGFIEKKDARPSEYFAPIRPWMDLLRGADRADASSPTWRYWGQIYAFLAHARQWTREADSQSPYVASTRARDVFEEFKGAFEENRIRVPSPARYQGDAYFKGFLKTVEKVIQWIPEHL